MPVLDIGDWKKQDKIQKWITSKKVWAAMCFPNDQVLLKTQLGSSVSLF